MNKLLEIQAHISNENKTAYLMGDYNINLLNFGTHNITNDFVNDVISHGFLPYIMKPTRTTPTSATLIDHIYSNHRYTHSKSGKIITDLADHFGIFHIVYDCTQITKPEYNIHVRQLKHDNIVALRNILSTADFSSVFSTENPDSAYDTFLQIYIPLFSQQ